MEAGGADTAGIECVPCVSAGAGPEIVRTGRPVTERAANTRTRCAGLFLIARAGIHIGLGNRAQRPGPRRKSLHDYPL